MPRTTCASPRPATGLTRALDGIKPYRMEYTVELPSTGCPLDAYWRTRITDRLIADVQAAGGILVNLASREIQQSLDWRASTARCGWLLPSSR